MAQIFHRSTNTLSRVSIYGAVFIISALGWVAWKVNQSAYFTEVNLAREQPVPFSHEHHAGQLGIDCRYCHASVESSSFAGLPATHTCMTCHSQIWTGAPLLAPVRDSLARDKPIVWRRVSGLPDYVYFNHQIHIGRGVPCVTCHGRIDQMPMTYRGEAFKMRFCLDCHRHPETRLKPPDQVTRMDWTGWTAKDQARFGAVAMKTYHLDSGRMTDCSLCHR